MPKTLKLSHLTNLPTLNLEPNFNNRHNQVLTVLLCKGLKDVLNSVFKQPHYMMNLCDGVREPEKNKLNKQYSARNYAASEDPMLNHWLRKVVHKKDTIKLLDILSQPTHLLSQTLFQIMSTGGVKTMMQTTTRNKKHNKINKFCWQNFFLWSLFWARHCLWYLDISVVFKHPLSQSVV